MSAVNLAELVAELKESLRVQASWLERLNARLVELENERKQIIDALPVCPTCDGEPPTADLAPGYFHNCTDCTDGRMDVFRALAITRAVMDAVPVGVGLGGWRVGADPLLLTADGLMEALRAVSP